MAPRKISLFLAGDALIIRPWSHVRDPDFARLVEEIRAADVAITNLETVIHEFKGHAQADSGGVHLASPPSIAAELKWAGFDMVAHANNHSFDYGSMGVLETIEHAEAAGLIIAGSGKDLQAARAPKYCRCDGGTVALVAMASDFVPYGRASHSRTDHPGRPGINPLATIRERTFSVPRAITKKVKGLERLMGQRPWKLRQWKLRLVGAPQSWQLEEANITANLGAISAAASQADIVVVSVHAHRQGPWLQTFARRAIESGAHVIFIHGPHRVHGIELYRGRPIFYCLGDFVFETAYVQRFAAEHYELLGLPHDAPASDLKSAGGGHMLNQDRKVFEGFVVTISFTDDAPSRIRLIPIDLQFDTATGARGRPQMAGPELGRQIIAKVAAESRPYGTAIRYDSVANRGEVLLADR
jgi:poly-gamma-glutamate synthesis protein (capsule biosynthesis protein)